MEKAKQARAPSLAAATGSAYGLALAAAAACLRVRRTASDATSSSSAVGSTLVRGLQHTRVSASTLQGHSRGDERSQASLQRGRRRGAAHAGGALAESKHRGTWRAKWQQQRSRRWKVAVQGTAPATAATTSRQPLTGAPRWRSAQRPAARPAAPPCPGRPRPGNPGR